MLNTSCSDLLRSMLRHILLRLSRHRSWQIRQPAAQSKLLELHPKGSAYCKGPLDRLLTVRYACFVPVVAINKPDFLAGYSLSYVSARYRGDFLAAIENNRNWNLFSPLEKVL